MSHTVIAPAGFVLGDGTTAASVARERWVRFRWLGGAVLLAALTVVIAILVPPRSDVEPNSIHNPQPDGARALAQVLQDHGVTVVQTRTLEETAIALGAGDTLVIAAERYYLDAEQSASIARHPGTIMWLGPDSEHLYQVDSALTRGAGGGNTSRRPQCQAPAAVQATTTSSARLRDIELLEPRSDVTVCFPGGTIDSGAYVVVERGEHDIHLISDASIVTNARIAELGNAALAINAAGQSPRVVWYIGSLLDDSILSKPDDRRASDYIAPVAPEWVSAAGVMMLLVAVIAVLWRGRRMGKLVSEPLPVIVRASEATKGRARLYRRAQSRGHASSAMRAGAASRMARRLGMTSTASPQALVTAIAGATGRGSADIEAVLYGPPPVDNASMIHLVEKLDTIEKEVSRS